MGCTTSGPVVQQNWNEIKTGFQNKEYNKIRVISKGYLGIKHLVVNKADEEFVLQKVEIPFQYDDYKEEVKKCFDLEKSILSSIESRYLVKYLDQEEENFYLLEYANQGSIAQIVENPVIYQQMYNTTLFASFLFDIAIDIFLGLHDIHTKANMRHRNLTAEKILVHNNQAKILGLGYTNPSSILQEEYTEMENQNNPNLKFEQQKNIHDLQDIALSILIPSKDPYRIKAECLLSNGGENILRVRQISFMNEQFTFSSAFEAATFFFYLKKSSQFYDYFCKKYKEMWNITPESFADIKQNKYHDIFENPLPPNSYERGDNFNNQQFVQQSVLNIQSRPDYPPRTSYTNAVSQVQAYSQQPQSIQYQSYSQQAPQQQQNYAQSYQPPQYLPQQYESQQRSSQAQQLPQQQQQQQQQSYRPTYQSVQSTRQTIQTQQISKQNEKQEEKAKQEAEKVESTQKQQSEQQICLPVYIQSTPYLAHALAKNDQNKIDYSDFYFQHLQINQKQQQIGVREYFIQANPLEELIIVQQEQLKRINVANTEKLQFYLNYNTHYNTRQSLFDEENNAILSPYGYEIPIKEDNQQGVEMYDSLRYSQIENKNSANIIIKQEQILSELQARRIVILNKSDIISARIILLQKEIEEFSQLQAQTTDLNQKREMKNQTEEIKQQVIKLQFTFKEVTQENDELNNQIQQIKKDIEKKRLEQDKFDLQNQSQIHLNQQILQNEQMQLNNTIIHQQAEKDLNQSELKLRQEVELINKPRQSFTFNNRFGQPQQEQHLLCACSITLSVEDILYNSSLLHQTIHLKSINSLSSNLAERTKISQQLIEQMQKYPYCVLSQLVYSIYLENNQGAQAEIMLNINKCLENQDLQGKIKAEALAYKAFLLTKFKCRDYDIESQQLIKEAESIQINSFILLQRGKITKDLKDRVQIFENALTLNKNNNESLEMIFDIYMSEKNYQKAEFYISMVDQEDRYLKSIVLRKIKCMQLQNKWQPLINYLTSFQAQLGDFKAFYYICLIESYLKINNKEQADSTMNENFQLQSVQNLHSLLKFSYILICNNQIEKAESYYDQCKALKLQSLTVNLKFYLVIKAINIEKSKRYIEDIIKSDKNKEVPLNKNTVIRSSFPNDPFYQQIKNKIYENPMNHELKYALIIYLFEENKYEEVINHAGMIYNLNFLPSDIVMILAVSYLKTGVKFQASQTIDTYLENIIFSLPYESMTKFMDFYFTSLLNICKAHKITFESIADQLLDNQKAEVAIMESYQFWLNIVYVKHLNQQKQLEKSSKIFLENSIFKGGYYSTQQCLEILKLCIEFYTIYRNLIQENDNKQYQQSLVVFTKKAFIFIALLAEYDQSTLESISSDCKNILVQICQMDVFKQDYNRRKLNDRSFEVQQQNQYPSY